jgi:hypothetical protein
LVYACHDAFLQSLPPAANIVRMLNAHPIRRRFIDDPTSGTGAGTGLMAITVRLVFSLLIAVLTACSAGPERTDDNAVLDTAPASPAAPGIDLRIEPLAALEGGGIQLDWSIRDDESLAQPFIVALPHSWAGREGFSNDIRRIRVRDTAGQDLPWTLSENGRLSIDHPALMQIELSYQVRPRNRLLVEGTRFRALMGTDMLYVPGHAAIAQPISAGTDALAAIHVTIGRGLWSTLPEPDAPLTRLADLVDSAVVGGSPLVASNERVTVLVQPGVTASADALLNVIERVVNALSPAMGPLNGVVTAIVLRRADDPDALSGHGRLGGFVLELGDNARADDPALLRLAGHEHLHRLIGHGIRFAAADELSTLWFREGVTDYVAVSTMVRAGLLPAEELFGLISRAITNLRANPADGARPGAASEYWSDRDLRRLPYDRGALLAMMIELQTIDDCGKVWTDLLQQLSATMEVADGPLDNATVAFALEQACPADWQTFFARYIIGVERLPVHDRLAQAGLQVVERLEPAPYHGFRANMTASGEWYVSEVDPEGPAAEAGVRLNMRLAGEPEIPTGRTARPAVLRLDEDGIERTVVVAALLGQRRVFAVIETAPVRGYVPGAYRQAFLLAGVTP